MKIWGWWGGQQTRMFLDIINFWQEWRESLFRLRAAFIPDMTAKCDVQGPWTLHVQHLGSPEKEVIAFLKSFFYIIKKEEWALSELSVSRNMLHCLGLFVMR